MDSKVFRGIKVATAGLVSVGLVSGLALLSFGIFSLFDSVNGLITEKYIPGGLIILGACISIVAALGLLGLAANNRAVILSFAILAGILLLAQIALIITAASARRTTADLIDQSWSNAWNRHPRVIRDVEETFQCCGLHSTTDRAYPKSSEDACIKSPDFGYKDSCYDSILGTVQAHQASILTIAIVIAVVQMLTFGLSLTLYMHMPTTEQREAGLLAEHERLVGESRSGYGSTS